MEVLQRPIREITPYENNPRNNDSAVDAVAASIREFGWQQPIVVDKGGVIIAGHTRYKAARKLGLAEVPVVVADKLTEEQIKAYRLADNKSGELADWDMDLLSKELAGISMDMAQFGFDEKELETEIENTYTSAVNIPQYEVQGEPPPVVDLYDDTKCQSMIEEINASELPDMEKNFLRIAAYRHIVFDYTKIAEFYAAASPECQKLMERSALVIIDVDDAIANGYVTMCAEIDRLREEDTDA